MTFIPHFLFFVVFSAAFWPEAKDVSLLAHQLLFLTESVKTHCLGADPSWLPFKALRSFTVSDSIVRSSWGNWR